MQPNALTSIWTSSDHGVVFFIRDGALQYIVTEDGGQAWHDPMTLLTNMQTAFTIEYGRWHSHASWYLESWNDAIIVGSASNDIATVMLLDAETLEIMERYEKPLPLPITGLSIALMPNGDVKLFSWVEPYDFEADLVPFNISGEMPS